MNQLCWSLRLRMKCVVWCALKVAPKAQPTVNTSFRSSSDCKGYITRVSSKVEQRISAADGPCIVWHCFQPSSWKGCKISLFFQLFLTLQNIQVCVSLPMPNSERALRSQIRWDFFLASTFYLGCGNTSSWSASSPPPCCIFAELRSGVERTMNQINAAQGSGVLFSTTQIRGGGSEPFPPRLFYLSLIF